MPPLSRIALLLCCCFSANLLCNRNAIAQQSRFIPVRYDTTRCDYCRMIFQDKNFGGALETLNDSLLLFDASECLAAFLIGKKISPDSLKRIWSVEYLSPRSLINAPTAWYLRSDGIMSPMEANIAAFASRHQADSVRAKLGGEVLDWGGVVRFIRDRWFRKDQLR